MFIIIICWHSITFKVKYKQMHCGWHCLFKLNGLNTTGPRTITCNRSVELNNLVAKLSTSRWQLVNKLGTSSANTSCWQVVGTALLQVCYSFVTTCAFLRDDFSIDIHAICSPKRMWYSMSINWNYVKTKLLRASKWNRRMEIIILYSLVKQLKYNNTR
jgi:hypothetical protein